MALPAILLDDSADVAEVTDLRLLRAGAGRIADRQVQRRYYPVRRRSSNLRASCVVLWPLL